MPTLTINDLESVQNRRALLESLLAQKADPSVFRTAEGSTANLLADAVTAFGANRAQSKEAEIQQKQTADLVAALGGGPDVSALANVPGGQEALVKAFIAQKFPAPGKAKDTFEPIFDKNGNIVGQRNTTTNRVVTDPRGLKTPEQVAQQGEIAGVTEAGRFGGVGTGQRADRAAAIAASRARATADIPSRVQRVQNITPEGEAQPTAAAPATTVFEAASKGTGPVATGKEVISNLLGPFISGRVFADTTESRQALRIFNQEAKTALVNNPRFPVAEQQVVQKLLGDTEKVFKDPDVARQDMVQLHDFLTRKRQTNQSLISAGGIPRSSETDLREQNVALDRVLNLMGDPNQADTANAFDDPEKEKRYQEWKARQR